MREGDRPGLLVPLVHREVDDPGEAIAALFDQLELLADPGADQPRQPLGLGPPVADEEHGVAVLQVGRRLERGDPLGIEELGDRALGLLARRVLDVAEPGRAQALRIGDHLVEEAPRPPDRARRRHGTHHGPLLDRAREHREAAAPEDLADLGDLDRVAQIRLVGAVAHHRVAIGDAWERQGRHLPVGELDEDAVHHRLDRSEHVLLLDEGHLQVELVELARAAVGAGVLVAEAGRDLEVAVEARDHEQLLVLLRRLGQGVELAGMEARGHEEVARALGRARGQDRGLELDEALRLHPPADARDDFGAQQDVLLHQFAAQVEEAVAQPGLLGVVALGVDLERQEIGRRLEHEIIGDQLDFPGRQLGIDRLGAARDHMAGDGEHALQPGALGEREEAVLGLEHDLGDAEVIAQVDEQQLAMIALPMHPARQAHVCPTCPGAARRSCGCDRDAWGLSLCRSPRPASGACRPRRKGHPTPLPVKPAWTRTRADGADRARGAQVLADPRSARDQGRRRLTGQPVRPRAVNRALTSAR